jgi:hypothetical protein
MLKKILLAAALVGVSGAALAHPRGWPPAYGYRAHHYYYPPVVYPPAVRYYPAPRVIVPAPALILRLRLPL